MTLRFTALVLALISVAAAQNWPSFRGPAASGVADNQNLPVKWDTAHGTGIQWTAALPGLAHSSPIVWQDRIFVTTAVSSRPDASFKRGLYGEGDASDDVSPQQWKLICLDRRSGKILWDRTAYEGTPKEKRHMKATYANSTPATDGKVVIAFFGSQGLYAYDLGGKLLWKRDLGKLNVGAYDLPEYE
jgi:outer membrane protein assembly factor BamB